MNEPRDRLGRRLDDCGCCEGVAASTPGVVANRPGLPMIAYRVGTHADFKRSMLARLSSADLPALADLRTRDDRDFAIALIDAWAATADVLTLYQERIVNESFLRTATERESLVELARLIGYRLKPGVAASTCLAFTVDEPVAATADAGRAMASAPGPTGRANIDVGLKVQSVPGPDEKPQIFETVEKLEARAEWNAMRPRRSTTQAVGVLSTVVWLDGADHGLEVGQFVLVVGMFWGTNFAVARRIEKVAPDPPMGRTRVDLEPQVNLFAVVDGAEPAGVWAMRVTAAPFGHSAGLKPEYVDGVIQDPETWGDWALDATDSNVLPLDGRYTVVAGTWVLVDRQDPDDPAERLLVAADVESVRTTSRAEFGISGRVTELTLDDDWRFASDDSLSRIRDAVVLAGAEELPLAETPMTSFVTGETVVLDSKVDGLAKGQRLAVVGLEDGTGAPISEVVRIQKVELTGSDRTRLHLKPGLDKHYRRDTVAINGNVVLATHGESVVEIMGSGDATSTYQEFELRQPPLTHVAASSGSGAESTLEVRVDDVRWHEVDTLYGGGPEDRVFVTRTADDGTTSVQFGDGATGARLPSGQLNVRARYRKGIGTEALVGARQLSQLMTRPLGIKDVINPLPAEGAEDPQAAGNARRDAPLTVRTLDRVVSLLDYEDFARNFAGVDKALATWTWDGRANHIFITVAGPAGAVIHTGGVTHSGLGDALKKHGDPHVSFEVLPYRPVPFTVGGTIEVHPDHRPESVLASAIAALRDAFSFDRRAFSRPVMRSEVVAVLHTVAGVVAVDIDEFHRTDQPTPADPWLEAAGPELGPDGVMVGAELLTLTSEQLDGLVVTS